MRNILSLCSTTVYSSTKKKEENALGGILRTSSRGAILSSKRTDGESAQETRSPLGALKAIMRGTFVLIVKWSDI